VRPTRRSVRRQIEWRWHYLLTMLDDFNRYIVVWKLYTTMASEDVKDLLERAATDSGMEGVQETRHGRQLKL
jgi:transposase InsO family protein